MALHIHHGSIRHVSPSGANAYARLNRCVQRMMAEVYIHRPANEAACQTVSEKVLALGTLGCKA